MTGLAVPGAEAPEVSVAHVASLVRTAKTGEGQVTVAYAVASGVQAGPLSVAEVRSLAITKARGVRGTTSAMLVRQWCGIAVAGPDSTPAQPGCVNADSPALKDFLDQANAAALQKIQLSVPRETTQRTPGGYQAVVTKHPGQRATDQTVNDDDSHTVAAFQAVVYNDGGLGRNRIVVQLAGVHAESRYGITVLPDFGSQPPAAPPAAPPAETPPPAAPIDPGELPSGPSGPTPTPDVFTPETFIDEETSIESFRGAVPAVQPRLGPVGDSGTRTRIIEVPVRVFRDAINLLVQHPREFALLFVLFALLASPVYLGSRRRSFARALLS